MSSAVRKGPVTVIWQLDRGRGEGGKKNKIFRKKSYLRICHPIIIELFEKIQDARHYEVFGCCFCIEHLNHYFDD